MIILISSQSEFCPPPIVLFNWGRCPKGRGGFDELVKYDEEGMLAEVRKAAEGVDYKHVILRSRGAATKNP